LPIAVGVILYLLYVVRIGGDFMSGRFLAAPLLCSVALLVRRSVLPGHPLPLRIAPLAAALAIGFASIDPPLLSGPKCGVGRQNLIDGRGISDERAYYYQGCGLLRAFDGCRLPCHFLRTRGLETRELGRQLITAEAIGLVGLYGGPGPHFVDFYGLSDPFVARQPMKAQSGWRIGHLVREIPQQYLDSITAGKNLLTDPRQRKLYDDLMLITRGPILSGARIGAIMRVNLSGI
jgi:arabinofuranosyltransferase